MTVSVKVVVSNKESIYDDLMEMEKIRKRIAKKVDTIESEVFS